MLIKYKLKKWIDLFNNDDNLKLLAKNSSWLLASNFISLFIDFIHSIIIARWLGVKGYGLLSIIVTYTVIINQLVDFRVWEAATKYISEFLVKDEKEKALATIKLCYLVDAFTGILAFLIVVFTSYFAATYIFHDQKIYPLIILYSMSLLFSTVNGTSMAILRIFDKFSWLSIYAVSFQSLRLILVIVFLLFYKELGGVILAYILNELFGGIVILALSLSIIKNKFQFTKKANIFLIRSRFKEIFQFLINTNLNELANLFSKNIDIIILGYFRNPVEVGFYRLAKNVTSLIESISNPFYQAIYPVLTKMWAAKKFNEFKNLIYKSTFLIFSIIFPIIICIYVFIEWIILWTVGIEFKPAASAVRIMLLGGFVANIFVWTRPALLSMGKAGLLTTINVFFAVTMFFLSLFVVPLWGYVGSSIMFLYPILFGQIVTIIVFFRLVKNIS